MKEIWKDIEGYVGLYQVSNLGRVKSLVGKEERFLRPGSNRTRYFNVVLYKERIKRSAYMHRLLAITFIPNPENKREVNHKNGDRGDNRLENLEWTTTRENALHGHSRHNKTSKFAGVSLLDRKKLKKWGAHIRARRRNINLGCFHTEEEAHQAYLDALNKFGIENRYAA